MRRTLYKRHLHVHCRFNDVSDVETMQGDQIDWHVPVQTRVTLGAVKCDEAGPAHTLYKQALALSLTLPSHTVHYQCSPQTILTDTDVRDVLWLHFLILFYFHPTDPGIIPHTRNAQLSSLTMSVDYGGRQRYIVDWKYT
ncbi:hypothetical protein J6590_061337 [Homalodisca vitripennis]|nr:hypothetical protein J6590_061337 [Homalodisca vitripennis]